MGDPGQEAITRKVTIRGLPIFAGELLREDSPALTSLLTIEDFRLFASQLRGQFCLVVEEGPRITAITDFGCSRPVFYLRDQKTLQYRVSARLKELIPFSAKRLRKEALFFYATRGGVGISPFYADIDEVYPATVMRFEEGRMESRSYLDWNDFLEIRPVNQAAAEQRFIEIASGYLGAAVKGRGDVGCLLSGGTDSALIAWLLRELGVSTRCFTADYSWEKYSEYASAAETARAAGLTQERAPISAATRRAGFRAVNTARQNSPCSDGLSPIFYQMAAAAARHGISTVVTGDHADSLFLGFERFFRGFPTETQACLAATNAMTADAKLERLYPSPGVNPECGHLLAAFGYSMKECIEWDQAIYREDCRRMSQWTGTTPLHVLQQLGGQMWAGISWQNLFLPVIEAFDDGVEFVSPFYDIEMIRFALSLPFGYKFRDGSTKALLRDILTRVLGRTVGKRASPNPARIWRLIPDLAERSMQGRRLRSTYDHAFLRNYAQKGMAWQELDKVAALGLWLSAHSFSEC